MEFAITSKFAILSGAGTVVVVVIVVAIVVAVVVVSLVVCWCVFRDIGECDGVCRSEGQFDRSDSGGRV